MAWQLPPLNPLRAFEAAARNRSMTKAAEELNVTQSAISNQVRALEQALGVRLFARLYRGIALTAAGEEYFDHVSRIFGDLDAATNRIAPSERRQKIRISGYNTFNMRWLIPRLADFHARFPNIQVHIASSMMLPDWSHGNDDGAIRTGAGTWPGLDAVYLAGIELSPVCATGFASKLRVPADLRHHTLLHSANRPHAWSEWLDTVGEHAIDPKSGLVFDNGVLCYQAAIQGIGVAIAERLLVEDDIQSGRLVFPFRQKTRERHAYYFVSPPDRKSAALTAFRDWLVEQAAALPADA